MHYTDIAGQELAKGRLRQMIADNRIPHALLLTGQEGFGGLPLAIAFVQHLFCVPKNDVAACGKCPQCLKISGLQHPDLHLVFPVALSKEIRKSDNLVIDFREAFLAQPYLSLDQWFAGAFGGNKQPVIAVDEAADILRKLSYTSYEGANKVMVIWYPEKMNTEAANKLLKILEEPPEKTIFILVTSEPDKLLTTILSRVQVIPLQACSDAEIEEALVSRYKLAPETAKQTALMAGGNFGEALALLDRDEESVQFLNSFQAFMRLALKFDSAKAVQWIDDCAASGRERQKQFLRYGLEVFRDSLMYNFGSKDLVRLSGEEKQFLEKFAPFVNQNNYEKLVEEFNSNYYYIERNANPKILFMDLMLKTNELINVKG